MMTSFWADILLIRENLGQRILICVIASIFIAITTSELNVIPPVIMFMLATQVALTSIALDELNGWEGFRCSMPVSRTDIIMGRMLFVGFSVLVAAAFGFVLSFSMSFFAPLLKVVPAVAALGGTFDPVASLLDLSVSALVLFVMLSVVMPLYAKYGATKSVRLMPLAFVLLFVLVFTMFGIDPSGPFRVLDTTIDTYGPLLISVAVLVAGLALFAGATALSAKLYQSREF